MSLLMKALEQAAKDRGETRGAAAASTRPAATESKPELSLALELLSDDTPSLRTPAEATPSSRPAASGGTTTAGREQALGATVRSAGARANTGLTGYRRINPVVAVGGLAGLFALGFAAYVYLQIYHPGIFAQRNPPAASPAPAPPMTTPPAPAASANAQASAPIPSSAVLQSPASLPPGATAATEPAAASGPAAPAPPRPSVDAPVSRITISRGASTAIVNPLLTEAYAALQADNLDAAQRLYTQLTKNEPRSIDAWLGLAAVASQQGKTDEATRHYLQVLELDPRHALAQSGLIGLLGRGDPLGAETRLKQLIAREPSAFLFFTLGNLYADQSLWAQAQHAYFQAHHLEPGNPDYAYNLAVGLEHLGQPKLALGFYRDALGLAASRGHANFNAAQVQERIRRLASQVE